MSQQPVPNGPPNNGGNGPNHPGQQNMPPSLLFSTNTPPTGQQQLHSPPTDSLFTCDWPDFIRRLSQIRFNSIKGVLNARPDQPASPEELEAERPALVACHRKLELAQRFLTTLPAGDSRYRREAMLDIIGTRAELESRRWRFFKINDLPTEIILHILKMVSNSPGDFVRVRGAITSVCRLWRQLAIEDPTLWNGIMINTRNWARVFDRVGTWIERAQNTRLAIRFDDGHEVTNPDGTPHPSATHEITDAEMAQLLNLLETKVFTTSNLIFLVRNWGPVLTFVEWLHKLASKGRPLLLERLELFRTGDLYLWPNENSIEGHDKVLFPLIGGPVAPLLNWITLSGVHFDWKMSAVGHLTCLDLRRLPLELAPTKHIYHNMLKHSPLLTRMLLDGAGPQLPKGWQDEKLQPVALNQLKLLLLSNLSPQYVTNLLDCFTCPNLVDLQLICLRRVEYGPAYEQMHNRFNKVRLFSMFEVDILPDSVEPFVRFLGTMTSVTYMRLTPPTNPIGPPGGAEVCFAYDAVTARPLPGISPELLQHLLQYEAPFLDEVSSYDPEVGPIPSLPNLKAIEVRNISSEGLHALLELRRLAGRPLSKTYAHEPHIYREGALSAYMHDNHIVPCVTAPGRMTPEEAEAKGM
ncbi:hypothetical protein CYLTODRAFT_12449 [Cylindrobasidium torrendii FP15055 ss-10]|uniref:F-box domain-containing protein n=1 Tax=Cylindrobasidium torrendii FP15055 ss-10 TaxID=1314674 RepID=A0A0D7BAN1_9AGAR|nr:hypothetical protein CYLTODRAFT_12449 [Cylindrobasidium torrendii FP15055 ss-10]